MHTTWIETKIRRMNDCDTEKLCVRGNDVDDNSSGLKRG